MTLKEALKTYLQAAPLSYSGELYADFLPVGSSADAIALVDAGTWAPPVLNQMIHPRIQCYVRGTDRAALGVLAHTIYSSLDRRNQGALELASGFWVAYSKVDVPPQSVGRSEPGRFAFTMFLDFCCNQSQQI